jgi:hypothetical protein
MEVGMDEPLEWGKHLSDAQVIPCATMTGDRLTSMGVLSRLPATSTFGGKVTQSIHMMTWLAP